MTIGIIGAMDEEIEYLLQNMTHKKEVLIANTRFIEGKLRDKKVVLLQSGIGKVNAAMAATIMHECFSPKYVINTGSAGGFSSNLEVGDLVISNKVVYHDVDVTAFNYSYGQVPQMPPMFSADPKLVNQAESAAKKFEINAVTGLIATGDAFMEDPERVAFIRGKFPMILASEMEAAAIAQVSYQYGKPFVIIRALSDIAGKESSISFESFLKTAAQNAAMIIIEMIENI